MNKKGFTLVEIMIVVLIIGLLAAIAIPNFIKARTTTQKNACIDNLRVIEGAKEQWAMEEKKGASDTPDQAAIEVYMKAYPTCPAGGEYEIGAMSTPPTCTLGDSDGHVLPSGTDADTGS